MDMPRSLPPPRAGFVGGSPYPVPCSGRHRRMETKRTDDDPDRPDEIDQAEEIGQPGFGEQDEAAQDAEYAEDAREGGS